MEIRLPAASCYYFAMEVARPLVAFLLVAVMGCGDDCKSGTRGGDCNVVTQCGCQGSQICMIAMSYSTCDWIESCREFAPGQLEVGEEYMPGEQDYETGEGYCGPGMVRWTEDSLASTGWCYEWCRDDTDCSAEGSLCAVEVTGTPAINPSCPDIMVPAPYRACTQ